MKTKPNNDPHAATQQTRVDVQVNRICLSNPFFAHLLLHLKRVADPAIPTMCTDGKSIRWSPAFAASISDNEIRGVLIHEVLHCALLHLWRTRSHWDHRLANVAADFAVNAAIEAHNKTVSTDLQFSLPKGALIDHQYDALSFEEIYLLLEKKMRDDESFRNQVNGGVSDGEFVSPSQGDSDADDGEGGTDANGNPVVGAAKSLEAEWQGRVAQARQIAKTMGCMPGGLDRLIGDVGKPQVNWRDQLSNFMTRLSRDDYNWMTPDRRHIGRGVWLPAMRSESMPPIVVCVDTSGSVGADELNQFAAEIGDVLTSCRPQELIVLYVDTEVASVQRFVPGDQVVLAPKGGGGTDFCPAFEWVESELDGDPPAAVVYLTDGFGRFPNVDPDYPVLWCSTCCPESHYPFGDVVLIDIATNSNTP